jgi:PAS domain S-box-containing protein
MGTCASEQYQAFGATDITQRHYMHTLLEALPIGVCTFDAAGCIVSLNAEGERLLGWSEATCVGQSLHDLITCWLRSEDEEDLLCPVSQVLQTGKPAWTTKTAIRRRDETIRWVEVKCVPLDAPHHAGGLFTFRDLNHQLQLEHQLMRLASIPEESPIPIVELDAQANLLYANSAMMTLMGQYGFGPEGYPTILPITINQIVCDCLTLGKTLEGIEVVVAARHYAWTFFPQPELGLVRGYSVDLTERKRVEQELQRARDMALKASQMKSEFLANSSHELLTPLSGILGMTDLVLGTQLTSEQQECLEIVKNSAHSLHARIRDILDFSQIESGKLELQPQLLWLRHSLHDLLKGLAQRARQKGLAFSYEMAPEIPDHVIVDADRLRQILSNLIDNAMKFTAQGEVRVCGTLEAHRPNAVVVHFRVTDTGIGIPIDKQRIIFEPFTQVDGSTTRLYGGTGLGLTIATQLVYLMHGDIWVESAGPGTGSTFHFTVCLNLPEPAEPQPCLSATPTTYDLASEDEAEASSAPVSRPVAVFDEAAFLARVEGDTSLIRELVELFLVDAPQRLQHIEEAIHKADWQALAQAAHALKGAVGNFCATKAYGLTLHLESLARNGDTSRIADAYAALHEEMARLQEALAHFRTPYLPET